MQKYLLKIIKITFIEAVLLLLALPLFAQNGLRYGGAENAGMSNATITYSSLWATFHNQAALAGCDRFGIGISYHNAFLVEEMGTSSLSAVLPFANGVFGLSIRQFGYSKYSENKIGLAYAMKLSPKIFVGVQLSYLLTHIENVYGNHHAVLGELGIVTLPFRNFKIGAHIFNPTHTRLDDYDDERLPSIISFGGGYYWKEKLVIASQVEKDLENKMSFSAGVEYYLTENFCLRTGISTNPAFNSFGISYKTSNLVFSLAFSRHYALGYSPSTAIDFYGK